MQATSKSENQLTFDDFPPGKDTHRKIIGHLIMKNISFAQACRDMGAHVSTARQATHGLWDGDKAKIIRRQLLERAGLIEPQE